MDGRDMAAISNEGLAIEIKNLSIQIADLKATLAQNNDSYVRKELFELRMKELENQQVLIKLDIEKVRKESNRANWRSHTLTAAFTLFITLLITYVFNDIIRR